MLTIFLLSVMSPIYLSHFSATAETGNFTPPSSPPLAQKPDSSMPPIHKTEEASPHSLIATPLYVQTHMFYHLHPLPHSISDIPINLPYLPHTFWECMSHMTPHYTVCYFLCHKRPIKVVLTHQQGDHFEEYDDHATEFTCCPWCLLTDCSAYHHFSSQVSALLRLSNSSNSGWFVCPICAESWNTPTYHQHCIYGPDAFLSAYLVWEDLPTCDSVFMLLYENSVTSPDFQDRSAYAVWLGSNVSQTMPMLNKIHLLIIAYHLLRWAGELPR